MEPHPAFYLGAAIFFASAILFIGVVFAKGGSKRSKQIGVIIAVVRGEHGKTGRRLLIGSFGGVVLGALVLFAGVAANDVKREKLCQAKCVEAGHTRGTIGPSVGMNMTRRNTAAFVACTCTGGPGASIELQADSLR